LYLLFSLNEEVVFYFLGGRMRRASMDLFVIFAILLFTFNLFADTSITRGPDIGEIYYIGPTVTGQGIYHSTDFGETATCMDSTLNTNLNFGSIIADLTPGVIYGYLSPENLFISYEHGQEGSWIFRANNYHGGQSGITEGFLFCDVTKHSTDYGNTFIDHSLFGYFGLLKSVEIDNEVEMGYAIVYDWSVPDSIWLLITNDNFENMNIQYSFNWPSSIFTGLSRGNEPGEVYLQKTSFYGNERELYYSENFGESWIFKNYLLKGKISGGRQPCELFFISNYTQLMGEIKHTYIYHSLDYGETFTVHHPFSYGSDPYYANFEATPLVGNTPLIVQFNDLSSGENIESWEWDFDNDGIIDSYEQNPQYTYQDTGYYSVKLRICNGPIEDGYIKNDYIHVANGNGIDNEELHITNYELSNYPNPFNPTTTISFELPKNVVDVRVEIFNIKGQLIRQIKITDPSSSIKNLVTWDGADINRNKVSSGIYLYQVKTDDNRSSFRKMLLLK
jgi:PKD repeat protein